VHPSTSSGRTGLITGNGMKKILALTLLLLTSPCLRANEDQTAPITVNVEAKTHAKLNLLIGLVGKNSPQLREIASIIKHDLEFNQQFNVSTQTFKSVQSKKMIESIFEQGYPLAVFLNESDDKNSIEYRVYDTTQAAMIKGSKYTKRGQVLRGWAHNIADAVWNTLSGQEGFFSTKIAFAKDINRPGKKKIKHIYVADYDGSNEQELVSAPTVSIAPRWNNDSTSPTLFYSEYTNSNIRLVSVSMKKKRKVASNFDGVNMLPAFSADGKNVAYCASHGQGNCQLYYHVNGAFKKITNNQGNNVSPTFSSDGNSLYFCSDYQTGKPQIYCYNIKHDTLERLTQGGYCASPHYCGAKNSLAYCKIVGGTMQLFTYDVGTTQHAQITFDAGNKEECSWSPCGNFLLFSHELNDKSRIALLNTITNNYQYLTSQKECCSYPAWSPAYHEFPIVS